MFCIGVTIFIPAFTALKASIVVVTAKIKSIDIDNKAGTLLPRTFLIFIFFDFYKIRLELSKLYHGENSSFSIIFTRWSVIKRSRERHKVVIANS